MDWDSAARLIVQYWTDRDDRATALAIAYAESGLNEWANGDHLSIFDPEMQETLRPYSCLGYTSYGLFQINVYYNYNLLVYLSGERGPCELANWLKVPENNVYTAFTIWQNRRAAGYDPWSPWTVYRLGTYRQYLMQAYAAIDRVTAAPPEAPPEGVAIDPLRFGLESPTPKNFESWVHQLGIFADFLDGIHAGQ